MLLKYGSKGEYVSQVQSRLKELGYYKKIVDGDFSDGTYIAVFNFQKDQKLGADGVVGEFTWKALFNSSFPQPEVPKIIYQSSLLSTFGSPLEPSFKGSNIIFIDLSEFKSDLSHVKGLGSSKFGFWGHYSIKQRFKAAIRSVINRGIAKQLKTFDGCYVVRNAKSGKFLSCHSYGMAVDLNAATNPYNASEWDMTPEFVICFAEQGFEWGGIWNSPFDPMHFQLAWLRNWTIQDIRSGCRFPNLAPIVPA